VCVCERERESRTEDVGAPFWSRDPFFVELLLRACASVRAVGRLVAIFLVFAVII
jgi:hypothetical protein